VLPPSQIISRLVKRSVRAWSSCARSSPSSTSSASRTEVVRLMTEKVTGTSRCRRQISCSISSL
jgi:hypothetical protein